MLGVDDVRKQAGTRFDRNWRTWLGDWFAGSLDGAGDAGRVGDAGGADRAGDAAGAADATDASGAGDMDDVQMSVSLRPPRERDLATREQAARARAWVASWRECPLPGVEWQVRSWPSVGDQELPVRVRLGGAAQIALWAGREAQWEVALGRAADVRARLPQWWEVAGQACVDAPDGLAIGASAVVRVDAAAWCALDDADWDRALRVWDWLFAHSGESCYARQLPIRGVDTKWVERHGNVVRGLYRALTGRDFRFARPAHLFRCKACCDELALGGCREFALPALGLATLELRPDAVIICENLVNTLCLDDLPGVLAIHGAGFAVTELAQVGWLGSVPLTYWGDLDSNGFAILSALRSFAPHACSAMMDVQALHRYFDLCAEEPKPAVGELANLAPAERDALAALAQGDPSRGITNLRLEQERIEWSWAMEMLRRSLP